MNEKHIEWSHDYNNSRNIFFLVIVDKFCLIMSACYTISENTRNSLDLFIIAKFISEKYLIVDS